MRAYSVAIAFGLLLIALLGLQFLASPTKASTIAADVDITPEVFNLKKMGVITAYVSNLTKASVSYDIRDINMSTIGLYYGDSLIVEALHAMVENDILIVKFDAAIVADYIWINILYHLGISSIPPQASKPITLTVAGQLNSGEQFAGSDIIEIISP